MRTREALIDWLLERGGPVIRYRTATELLPHDSGVDRERLAADLLQSPLVREWLDRLTPLRPGDLFNLHGSNVDALENVCGKLSELGIRAGMPEALDVGLQPYSRYLAESGEHLGKLCLSAPLNELGYDDEAVRAHLAWRLDQMYALAQSGTYDIYIDQDMFGDYPAAFRKRRLVAPEFYPQLPGLWDMYALAHYPRALKDTESERRIETVVRYVLHPHYQALDEGYGIMRVAPRRYYAIGWSVHLPGYGGSELLQARQGSMLLRRLELMAHFPVARRSRWFRDSLRHLESFRTEQGTAIFPGSYLRDQPSGYWIQGAYMRLEEGRRSRTQVELESTFRMCKILSLVGDGPEGV